MTEAPPVLAATPDLLQAALEQSNLTGGVSAEDRASREQFERNWQQMLEGLRGTAES